MNQKDSLKIHLEQLLKNSENLSEKLYRIQKLNESWQQLILSPLKNYTAVANYEKNKLIIASQGPAWSTHLHYQRLEILKQFKSHPVLSEFKYLEWFNISLSVTIPAESRAKPFLSQASAHSLIQVAQNIKNKKLSEMLLHLASHRKQ